MVPPAIPLQVWCTLPLRPALSAPDSQGTSVPEPPCQFHAVTLIPLRAVLRGVVPAWYCAEVTRSASFHQRSVTAEAHGLRCGLRAYTTPCTWHHSLNHSAGTAPLITALRSIIVTAFHRHAASSTAALCPSSAPSSVLHFRARHPFRSTAAAPHVSRPPASARLAAGLALPGVPGTVCIPCTVFRSVTVEAHGLRCGLRTSTALQPAHSSPQSLSRLQSANQHQHLAVRPPSRIHCRSRSGTYRTRYG